MIELKNSYFREIKIESLVGIVINKIINGGESLEFHTDNGILEMAHYQDCCEEVTLEEIHGDIEWLLGEKIIKAERKTNSKDAMGKDNLDSFTWSFYELSTIKGTVTFRWLGQSNGYYSEDVEIYLRESPSVSGIVHELKPEIQQ